MTVKHSIRTIAATAVLCAASVPALLAQAVEDLRLTVGKSIVIDYPKDVARISTSNPEVVDYVAVSTREILLQSKANGYATLIVWSRDGQRTFYSITVDSNLDSLRKLLKDTFPADDIQLVSGRDSVSLNGRVANQGVADRAVALAASFAKTVVNNLVVAAPAAERQVILRVKFAELDRSVALQLGANLVTAGAGNTIARTTTGSFSPPNVTLPQQGTPSVLTFSDALNIFAFRPDLNIGAFVKALQSQGVLQILAEPNLVTSEGHEASFLVGGEFPVPVVQGGSNSGSVTIQFREFGIRLTFKPTITESGSIKMYVKPEVSTIDTANGVNFSGFLIPALSTRRIESNVELNAGQSFVIGGLIDDRVTDSISKIPGLANIPVLGALFKTKDERKQKTELVIMVTPEFVRPLQPNDPAPLPVFPRQFLAPLPPIDLQKNGSTTPPAGDGQKSAHAIRGKYGKSSGL
jgi:pilus assembly protein CpaC